MRQLKETLLLKGIVENCIEDAVVIHLPHQHLLTLQREDEPMVVTNEEDLRLCPSTDRKKFDDEDSVHSTSQRTVSTTEPVALPTDRLYSKFVTEQLLARQRAQELQETLDQPQSRDRGELSALYASFPHNLLTHETLSTLWSLCPAAWWVDLSHNSIQSLDTLVGAPLALGFLDLRHNSSLSLQNRYRALSSLHVLRLYLSIPSLTQRRTDAESNGAQGFGAGCELWHGTLTIAANLPHTWVFNDHFLSSRERFVSLNAGFAVDEIPGMSTASALAQQSADNDNAGGNSIIRTGSRSFSERMNSLRLTAHAAVQGTGNREWQPRQPSRRREREGSLLAAMLRMGSTQESIDSARLDILLEDYLHQAFAFNTFLSLREKNRTREPRADPMPTLSNPDLLLFLHHSVRLDMIVLLTVALCFPSLPVALITDALVSLLVSYLPLHDIHSLPMLPPFVKSALISLLLRITLREREEIRARNQLSVKPLRPLGMWRALCDSGRPQLPSPNFEELRECFFLGPCLQFVEGSKESHFEQDFDALSANNAAEYWITAPPLSSDPSLQQKELSQLLHSRIPMTSTPHMITSNALRFTQYYLQLYSQNQQQKHELQAFSALEEQLLLQLPLTITQFSCFHDAPLSTQSSGHPFDTLSCVPNYCSWVPLVARHSVSLLALSSLCPPLTVPCRTASQQKAYMQMLPLLCAAKMTLLHLVDQPIDESLRSESSPIRAQEALKSAQQRSIMRGTLSLSSTELSMSAKCLLRGLPLFGEGLPARGPQRLRWNSNQQQRQPPALTTLVPQTNVDTSSDVIFASSSAVDIVYENSQTPNAVQVSPKRSTSSMRDLASFFITDESASNEHDITEQWRMAEISRVLELNSEHDVKEDILDHMLSAQMQHKYSRESDLRVSPHSPIRLLPPTDQDIAKLRLAGSGDTKRNLQPYVEARLNSPLNSNASKIAAFLGVSPKQAISPKHQQRPQSSGDLLTLSSPELFPPEFRPHSRNRSDRPTSSAGASILHSSNPFQQQDQSRPTSGPGIAAQQPLGLIDHRTSESLGVSPPQALAADLDRDSQSIVNSVSSMRSQLSVQLPMVESTQLGPRDTASLGSEEDNKSIRKLEEDSFEVNVIFSAQARPPVDSLTVEGVQNDSFLSQPRPDPETNRLRYRSPPRIGSPPHKIDVFATDRFAHSQFLVASPAAIHAYNHAVEVEEKQRSPPQTAKESVHSIIAQYWRELQTPPVVILPTKAQSLLGANLVHKEPIVTVEPSCPDPKLATNTSAMDSLRTSAVAELQRINAERSQKSTEEVAYDLLLDMGTLRNVRQLEDFNKYLFQVTDSTPNHDNDFDNDSESIESLATEGRPFWIKSLASKISKPDSQEMIPSKNVAHSSNASNQGVVDAGPSFMTGIQEQSIEHTIDDSRESSHSERVFSYPVSKIHGNENSLAAHTAVNTVRKSTSYPLVFSAEHWTERGTLGSDLFPVFHKPVLTISGARSSRSPSPTGFPHGGNAEKGSLPLSTAQLLIADDLPSVQTYASDNSDFDPFAAVQAHISRKYRQSSPASRGTFVLSNSQQQKERKRCAQNLNVLRNSKTMSKLLSASLPLLDTHVELRQNLDEINRAKALDDDIDEDEGFSGRKSDDSVTSHTSLPSLSQASRNRDRTSATAPLSLSVSLSRSLYQRAESFHSLDLSLEGSSVLIGDRHQDDDGTGRHSKVNSTSVGFDNSLTSLPAPALPSVDAAIPPQQTNHKERSVFETHRAFAAAAQSLLLSRVQRARNEEKQHLSKETVNGMPSERELLHQLFAHDDSVRVRGRAHKTLYSASASAATHKRVWVGKQHYNAAASKVDLDPAFKSKMEKEQQRQQRVLLKTIQFSNS